MTDPYYQDDFVTLYHGDCLELADVWTGADVLVTDPPYGVGLLLESRFTHCSRCGKASRSTYGTCRDCRKNDDERAPGVAVLGDATTEARDAALRAWGAELPALMFGTWRVARPEGTRTVVIWDKGNWTPPGDLSIPWASSHEEIYVLGKWRGAGRRGPGVVHHRGIVGGTAGPDRPDHPTPKPVALMSVLIAKCPPGTIADPFAGSGSTGVAAKALGRKAVLVELEERYCEIAARRLSQDVLDFEEPA